MYWSKVLLLSSRSKISPFWNISLDFLLISRFEVSNENKKRSCLSTSEYAFVEIKRRDVSLFFIMNKGSLTENFLEIILSLKYSLYSLRDGCNLLASYQVTSPSSVIELSRDSIQAKVTLYSLGSFLPKSSFKRFEPLNSCWLDFFLSASTLVNLLKTIPSNSIWLLNFLLLFLILDSSDRNTFNWSFIKPSTFFGIYFFALFLSNWIISLEEGILWLLIKN